MWTRMKKQTNPKDSEEANVTTQKALQRSEDSCKEKKKHIKETERGHK